MQAKLHCWAAADLGRRFDDLFNQGANTPEVDGVTAAYVREVTGVPW